tara:strand:- start:131 stop:295 length:165 start_codon:yes stop_codon:yes gene_type:complete
MEYQKNKKVKIPGNFGFGDLPAETRMRILKMQEEERKKRDEKKLKTLYNKSKMD